MAQFTLFTFKPRNCGEPRNLLNWAAEFGKIFCEKLWALQTVLIQTRSEGMLVSESSTDGWCHWRLPAKDDCQPDHRRHTDRLSLGFTSHSTQNRSLRRRSSQTIYRLSTEKLNLTQQKSTCIHNKIHINLKSTPKNIKPGLVASYDVRPGNGTGLFWKK